MLFRRRRRPPWWSRPFMVAGVVAGLVYSERYAPMLLSSIRMESLFKYGKELYRRYKRGELGLGGRS